MGMYWEHCMAKGCYKIVFAHPVSIWESYKIILGDSQLMRDHPYDHMNQLGDSCPRTNNNHYKGS